MRIGLLVFAVVLLFGCLGDYWQAYEGWQEVALIRLTVWSPLMFCGAWLVSRPASRGRVLDITFAVTVLVTLSLLALMLFGLSRATATDFPMYWTVMLLMVHVVTPLGLIRSVSAGMVVVVCFFATMLYHRVESLPMAAHTVFVLFAWALLITASWLLESRYRRSFLAERWLVAAREDSDRLLRAILPDAIAHRLKAGESTIADEVTDATVLFADLVGFTELSRRLTAPQVVAFLDGLFARFDQLAIEHGVDKVKTIGDSYMASAGTTGAPERAAQRVAKLALGLLAAARAHAEETGTDVRVRIGIHRGPVVAGIIGRRRFAYDLWGDTVNMASRMESHGQPGEIQVSEAVKLVLRGEFKMRERGPVVVKGVGTVQTFWLDG